MAVLLVSVALLVDCIQFLVEWLDLTVIGVVFAFIINETLSLIAVLLFYIWLKFLNVSFVSTKRAISFFGSLGLELIPINVALPWWTVGMVLTISTVWLEEIIQRKTGFSVAINAHLAVGNPNPVSNFGEFTKNSKGFANNLGKLSPNPRGFTDLMKEGRKTPKERRAELNEGVVT